LIGLVGLLVLFDMFGFFVALFCSCFTLFGSCLDVLVGLV
jgi:hypothetical protein